MLAKTETAEVSEKDLGLGIQFTVTVGQGRQIAMTAGVPLAYETGQLNALLDRMAGAMDRQTLRYENHDRKAQIENMEQQLATTRQQIANHEAMCLDDWERRGKQGAFRMSGDQLAKKKNFETTEQHLIEAIKKKRKELEDSQAQCL